MAVWKKTLKKLDIMQVLKWLLIKLGPATTNIGDDNNLEFPHDKYDIYARIYMRDTNHMHMSNTLIYYKFSSSITSWIQMGSSIRKKSNMETSLVGMVNFY